MEDDCVQEQCPGTWTVSSAATPSMSYTVTMVNQHCQCQLKCINCGACVHMYTCTCIDSALHFTVCKHVHCVHMKTIPVSSNVTNEDMVSEPQPSSLDYYYFRDGLHQRYGYRPSEATLGG